MRTPILLSLVFVGACSTALAGPLHEWPPVPSLPTVDPDYFDGLATKKVIQGFYGPPETRALTLNLYVPNDLRSYRIPHADNQL